MPIFLKDSLLSHDSSALSTLTSLHHILSETLILTLGLASHCKKSKDPRNGILILTWQRKLKTPKNQKKVQLHEPLLKTMNVLGEKKKMTPNSKEKSKNLLKILRPQNI